MYFVWSRYVKKVMQSWHNAGVGFLFLSRGKIKMYPKKFWNEFRLAKWSNKIFIGMWFDENNSSKRYDNIIKKAIEKTKMEPYFLKDLITGDSIPIEVMTGIIECKLTLFEISPMKNEDNSRNSNVMYELGLAHAWRNKEEVIIIRDDCGNLPIDIQSIGVIQYNIKDKERAIDKIKNTICFRLQEIEKIQKSMIRKAAESLNIQAHNVLMASKGKIFHDANFESFDKILAIPLLLNLGLVEMLTDIKGYGYHPTQLGREVIRYYNQPLEKDDIENYTTLYRSDY